MKIFLTILICIAALFAVLLMFPVRLVIDYRKDAVTNSASIVVKYLFFKIRLNEKKGGGKKEKKGADVGKKPRFSFEEQKRRLEYYIKVFGIIKEDIGKILDYAARRAVVFEELDAESDFGFENAMHTGIFTGIFNGFVYSVFGFIHHKSTLENMNVRLQPQFERVCFDFHLRCILRLKNVHIIIIAFNVLKLMRKLRKTERRD